jgi:hypothetical protein
MIDICQEILDKEVSIGRAAMDEGELQIFHIYRFFCEYENGGLSGFLYNISDQWSDITDLARFVEALERRELASELIAVEKIVRRGPMDYEGTWDGWLSLTDPDDSLVGCDQRISNLYEGLWGDLESLTSLG